MIKYKIIGDLLLYQEKKLIHKVQRIIGKCNIIHQLLEEYDLETSEDIQDALKVLPDGTIEEMMEAEINAHLGYGKSERSDSDDYRICYGSKRANSSYGSMGSEFHKSASPLLNYK